MLLHDIPRILIFFIEQLFIIFNQMLRIRAFGRSVESRVANLALCKVFNTVKLVLSGLNLS